MYKFTVLHVLLVLLFHFFESSNFTFSSAVLASEEDEGEEEPCDCGTMGPGECAPCPDEEG